MKRTILSSAATALLLPAACSLAFTVTKIADTTTPIPGGSGDFTHFVLSSGGTFIAQGNNNQEGIYTYLPTNYPGSATVGVLVSSGMATPGSSDGATFSSFQSVSLGGEGTSFVAMNSDGSQGVYQSWNGDELFAIATTGDSPSAGVTFTNFSTVSSTYQNNSQNPTGEFLSNAGVYFYSVGTVIYGGSGGNYSTAPVNLTLEANTSTIPQGSSSPFSALGTPNLKCGYPGGTLLGDSAIQTMRASVNGMPGIYYSPPESASSAPQPFFTKLADTATPSIVQFTSFGNPAANVGDLVFTAHYNVGGNDEQGIFAYENYVYQPAGGATPASLQELLASGTAAPDGNGAHFQDFLGVTPSGVFLADLDDGTEGLYKLASDINGGVRSPVSEILNSGEPFDGKTVQSIELPTEADLLYDGTSFIVNFMDGSQGLYFEQTAVPEPQALALLIPAAFLLRRRNSPL